MHSFLLNDGTHLPAVGFGIYKITSRDEMEEAVRSALDAGYTCFDTAQMYGNEFLLGALLARIGADRKNIFITTKLHPENMAYKKAVSSLEKSLRDLQTDYLDLCLIHWPGQKKDRLLEAWGVLEDFKKQGKIRSAGVSNCLPKHLSWILDNSALCPAVNQYERNPLNNPEDLYRFCLSHGIQPQAWAPLGRGNFDFPILTILSEKYQKTPAQIILRWQVQEGYAVIPKSARPERIRENIDIFDFEITPEEIAQICALDKGKHTSHDPRTYDF